MTLAWYGHLKLQQSGVSNNWPLIGVIAFSWMIAVLALRATEDPSIWYN